VIILRRVPITAAMAPSARIIAYTVAQPGGQGEVVADSLNFNVDGAFQNKVRSLSMLKEI